MKLQAFYEECSAAGRQNRISLQDQNGQDLSKANAWNNLFEYSVVLETNSKSRRKRNS